MSDTQLTIRGAYFIREGDLEEKFVQSGGPGGQNVNKVNSRVTLRWQFADDDAIDAAWKQRFRSRHRGRINGDGEVVIHSDGSRDQRQNLADARTRLRTWLIECAAPPKIRKATQPSRGSVRRRLESKRQRSEKKQSRRKRWD